MLDIRLLTTGEEPTLGALHDACFDEPFSVEGFRTLVASPGMWASLAWCADGDDGQPVGFVIARSIAGEAEIVSIGVHPAWRRRGIGAALLADAVARSAALGAAAVFLEVGEDNPSAIALYLSAGFETVGRRPDYYRRKTSGLIAALIMRYAVKKSVSYWEY